MGQLTRRQFLATGAAAGTTLALTQTRLQSAQAAGSRNLGIQLYTVAADMASDPRATLDALHKIGYRNVESAGFAKLSAQEFKRRWTMPG